MSINVKEFVNSSATSYYPNFAKKRKFCFFVQYAKFWQFLFLISWPIVIEILSKITIFVYWFKKLNVRISFVVHRERMSRVFPARRRSVAERGGGRNESDSVRAEWYFCRRSVGRGALSRCRDDVHGRGGSGHHGARSSRLHPAVPAHATHQRIRGMPQGWRPAIAKGRHSQGPS